VCTPALVVVDHRRVALSEAAEARRVLSGEKVRWFIPLEWPVRVWCSAPSRVQSLAVVSWGLVAMSWPLGEKTTQVGSQ
jgi:hypothetical protein